MARSSDMLSHSLLCVWLMWETGLFFLLLNERMVVSALGGWELLGVLWKCLRWFGQLEFQKERWPNECHVTEARHCL
jgi:hypothetical protein